MLDGQEQIDLNFIENMEQKRFVEKDDFLPMDGEPNSHVVLRAGDFLICYPGRYLSAFSLDTSSSLLWLST